VKYAAYRFDNDADLRAALQSLGEISEKMPGVQYNIVSKRVLVVPAYLRDAIFWIVQKYNGKELETGSFGDLDPKEQAKRRGLLLKRPA
jgi:hypothetical protein